MDLSLELYKKMYLIRIAEEAVQRENATDEIKSPCHMSIGQEHIVVGVCQALQDSDYVFGTYRSHGLYLAKTNDTDGFFAELYGKSTGACEGKGGSMHLANAKYNHMGSSAIVGTPVPVAVGHAFSNKYKNNNAVTAVFFGDAVLEGGPFYESMNIAALKEVPVLFVYEDNGLAVHTYNRDRQAFSSVELIVQHFCSTSHVSGTDVEEVYRTAKLVINRTRSRCMPEFLHLCYHRYLEHVGVNEDYHAGYRTREEFEKWLEVDPVKIQRNRLKIPEEEIVKIENEVKLQITNSIEFAKKSPFSDPSECFSNVFA